MPTRPGTPDDSHCSSPGQTLPASRGSSRITSPWSRRFLEFIRQCQRVFSAPPDMSNTQRLLYIVEWLGGRALVWAQAVDSRQTPISRSLDKFLEEFEPVFDLPSASIDTTLRWSLRRHGGTAQSGVPSPLKSASLGAPTLPTPVSLGAQSSSRCRCTQPRPVRGKTKCPPPS